MAVGLVLMTENTTSPVNKSCKGQPPKRLQKRQDRSPEQSKIAIEKLCCDLAKSDYAASKYVCTSGRSSPTGRMTRQTERRYT